MDSKALVKSTNSNVTCRFFARTPSRILRMVNICEVVDLFLRTPFWFFLRMSILGSMRFYAKSSVYIYIKYIWFGLVGFYGISTIVGYLMPNSLYTYILNIYMIWFGWLLWHINHCRLFNAKSSLYIYIKYILFGLVGFYDISTIVRYLIPNPLYSHILNIYDLIWLGSMTYQPL